MWAVDCGAGIYSARQNKVNRCCTVPGKKKQKQLGHARERVRLLRRVIRALAGAGEVGKFLVRSAEWLCLDDRKHILVPSTKKLISPTLGSKANPSPCSY